MAYYLTWLVGSSNALLTWNAVSGATGYRLDISGLISGSPAGQSGVYVTSVILGNVTSATAADLGLAAGQYYVIVRAIDSAAGESDASNEVTITIS